MSSVAMPRFGYSPNQFTLHNAAPVPKDVRWCGVQFTVPGVDQVGPRAAKFEDGAPIPGTVVLTDTWGPDRDGAIPEKDSPPNWSAYSAMRNILGINPTTLEATSVAAQGGISYLPTGATREQYETVRADGERRYQISLIEWANHQVQAHLEKVQKARISNAPAPPPDADYRKAVAILKRQEQEAEGETEEVGDELEFLALAKAKAMELAGKMVANKPNLDKEALAKELAEDPEFLNHLRKQGLRIRKKGYLEPEAEERTE